MKKIYWMRRLFLLLVMFSVGATVSRGIMLEWIKIMLGTSFVGYMLLMTEFDYDQQKRSETGATESDQK